MKKNYNSRYGIGFIGCTLVGFWMMALVLSMLVNSKAACAYNEETPKKIERGIGWEEDFISSSYFPESDTEDFDDEDKYVIKYSSSDVSVVSVSEDGKSCKTESYGNATVTGVMTVNGVPGSTKSVEVEVKPASIDKKRNMECYYSQNTQWKGAQIFDVRIDLF